MLEMLERVIEIESLDSNIRFLVTMSAILIEIVLKIAVFVIAKIVIVKSVNRIITKSVVSERKSKTLKAILSSVITYTIYIIIVLQIIPYFGVDPQSLLTITGVGTVALGIAAQSLVRDFLTGGFILMEDQFGVGDLVTIEDRIGVVENIGMRTTSIRSLNGDLHIFPNGEIKIVTNMSNEVKRAVVEIPVSYEVDIDNVLNILRDEMDSSYGKIDGLKEKPVVQGVVAFEKLNVIIRIIADCVIGESYAVERELRRCIKIRFERENISNPHPQMSFYANEK